MELDEVKLLYTRSVKMNIEFNVIATFDSTCEHILMCKRRKNPYKSLYNLIGGKIKNGEDGLSAAYRELEEETGVSKNDLEWQEINQNFFDVSRFAGEGNIGHIMEHIHLSKEIFLK